MASKRMRDILKDEKGATSVLVILMMIVLVSLGYFAIASANSNIKLSNNALDWNYKYFDIDRKGEIFVAEVDNALFKAQEKTNAYFTEKAYSALTHKDLPIAIHSEFYKNYRETTDEAGFFEDMMNKIYFFYADIELQALLENYPDVYIKSNSDGEFISGIVCDLTITHGEAADFHLDISLSVNSYSQFGYALIENAPSAGRYKISGWYQWQNEPNTENAIKVWDGIIAP